MYDCTRQLDYIVAQPYSARGEWSEEFAVAADFEEVLREPSPRNAFQRKSRIQLVHAFSETSYTPGAILRVAGSRWSIARNAFGRKTRDISRNPAAAPHGNAVKAAPAAAA